MNSRTKGRARLMAAIDFPFSPKVNPAAADARWWLKLCSLPNTDAPAPDPSDPVASLLEWIRHSETTQVHEAGHAVAMTLTGRRVRDLRVFMAPTDGSWGKVRPEPIDLSLRAAANSPDFGPHRLAREIVMSFAGPAAELRYDPSRYHSGKKDDWNFALEVASSLEAFGMGDRFTYLRWSLIEAHLMMLDDRVWAAVTEIADNIRARNVEYVATMRGKRIRAIVEKHLPDGWDWSGPFVALDEKQTEAA